MRWLIRCCHFFSYLLSKSQQALSNLSQCDHEKADKCIYILPYPVIIPAKLSPSSIHSYPLPPPLSSPSPDSHLSLSNPRWSLRSPSFISSRWFSRSESATTLWRRCRYWRQAYGGLGTPPVHITPHEWPKGRRKGGREKSQIAFSYHRGFCTLFRAFSPFPSALFSIRQALFLNLPGPVGTTLEKKTKRWNLASFPHVISLISPTHTHACTDTHAAATTHCSLVSRLSFSLQKLLLFLVIPRDTLDWIGKNSGRKVLTWFSTKRLKLSLTLLLRSKSVRSALFDC